MKSFNLGKSVKKWLQQGKNYIFIAELLNRTPAECIEAYRNYMGFSTPSIKSSGNLEELLLLKKGVHLYGGTGVGKTHLIKKFAEKLKLNLVVSYARSEEDLVRDFGDYPFQDDSNIFLLEGDAYYWKKYGLIKRYIQNAKSRFVVITNGKGTPTKNITKHLTQIKVYPPTKLDVARWLKEIDEYNFDEVYINYIYNKDWRVVIRNYLYGHKEEFKPKQTERFDARTFAYKLLKGEATPEDFRNCIHPFSFILNWLGWNTSNFFEGEQLSHNMEIVSYCDANKYSLGKDYLQHYLLEFIPANKKAELYFPPFKRNKEKDVVDEKAYEVVKYKKRNATKPTVAKKNKSIQEELGDFLLI